MGGKNVKADYAVLEKAGKELKTAAEELQEKVEEMKGKVEGKGDPFGGDELGLLTGITHQVISEVNWDKLGKLAEDLIADADALTGNAKKARERIDSAVKDIKKIQA